MVYRQPVVEGESSLGATIFGEGVPLRIVGLLALEGQSVFSQESGRSDNDHVLRKTWLSISLPG